MVVDPNNAILINGQWVDKNSDEAIAYMRSIGMLPSPSTSTGKDYVVQTPTGPVTVRNVTPDQTGDRLIVSSTGEVYTGPSSGPVTSARTGETLDTSKVSTDTTTPLQSTSEANKPLDIYKAVQQDNGDIAFQLIAGPNSGGILTSIDSMNNNKNLTSLQKRQLKEYVKNHPEQQFDKRTADEAPTSFSYDTGPAGSIMLTDSLGISRPAVKDINGKYVFVDDQDTFEAGDKINENVQNTSSNVMPFIMDWQIGYNPYPDSPDYRKPVFHKAAVLTPGMMVYPMSDNPNTIYPQNVPLTRNLDSRSGYYAVGFEGTVQNDIWYDPVSGRFYAIYLDKPTSAADIMEFTPGWAGGYSGAQVMDLLIDSNMSQNVPAVSGSSPAVNNDASDFKLPEYGTIDNKGNFISSNAKTTSGFGWKDVFSTGQNLSDDVRNLYGKFFNTEIGRDWLARQDRFYGFPGGTVSSAVKGEFNALASVTGGTIMAVGAVGALASGQISAQNLTRGATEGLYVQGYNLAKGAINNPVETGTELLFIGVAGVAGAKVVGRVAPVSDPMLTGVYRRSFFDTVSMSNRAKAMTRDLSADVGPDFSRQASAAFDIMRVADTTKTRNPVSPEPSELVSVPPELKPAIESTFADLMGERSRVYGGATQNQALMNEFRASKDLDIYTKSAPYFNEIAIKNINREYPGLVESSGNSVKLVRDFQSANGKLYTKGTKILDVHDAISPDTGLSNVLPSPLKNQLFMGGKNYRSPISSESLQSYGTMRKANALMSNLLEIKQQGGSHRFVKDFGDLIEYSKETMFTYKGKNVGQQRARIQNDIDTLLKSEYTYKPYPEGGEMAVTPVTKTGMEIYKEYLDMYAGTGKPLRVNIRPVKSPSTSASPISRPALIVPPLLLGSPSPSSSNSRSKTISPSPSPSPFPNIGPSPSIGPSPGPSKTPPIPPSPIPPIPPSPIPPIPPSRIPPIPPSRIPPIPPSPIPPSPIPPSPIPPIPPIPNIGSIISPSPFKSKERFRIFQNRDEYTYKNNPDAILGVFGGRGKRGKVKFKMPNPDDLGFNIGGGKGKKKKKRSVFDL